MSTRDEVEPGMSAGDLEREAARESRCCGAAMVRAEDGEGWMCEACQKPIEDEGDTLLWRAARALFLFVFIGGGMAVVCTAAHYVTKLEAPAFFSLMGMALLAWCWWVAKDE
mgnify:CR=1 FL=1